MSLHSSVPFASRSLLRLTCVLVVLAGARSLAQSTLAATPPMGWNSWDSFGTTVTEQQVRENAAWLARHLKPFGWEYVVVDEEWFARVPAPQGGGDPAKMQLSMDAHGRYTPAENRFPSSAHGAGMAPLAAYVHGLGLKFGVHLLQGVPRSAAQASLPIEGSRFTVADAADTSHHCSWSNDNYDVQENAAGQAYYDSVLRQLAGWSVDFVKVDCIASPFKGAEISMIARAIAKTGRPIVLSLSPGEAPLDKVAEMRGEANLWRISNDVWDLWHSDAAYPQGLGDQIPRLARWAGTSTTGHWSDADMLPLGDLEPQPGWGQPRETHLSHDEQRTLVTMWSIFRSPLMVGGNLPRSDAWTLSLLTNREVLAIDQNSQNNHPVPVDPGLAVWTAELDGGRRRCVAVVNLGDTTRAVQLPWKALGWTPGAHALRDLWLGQDLASAQELRVTLAPHASVLYTTATTR